jgi:hypothetical protein
MMNYIIIIFKLSFNKLRHLFYYISDECGHFPAWQNPEVFARELHAFVFSLEQSETTKLNEL